MNYKLFLDDIRNPKTEGPWVIVRSFKEAVNEIIKRGKFPNYISFDHDLEHNHDKNEEYKTGYDFARWLVKQDMNGTFLFDNNFKFNVHSANPIGKKNIEFYLNSYLNLKYKL